MEPLFNKSCIFCVVILFLCAAGPASGRAIYVDDDGPAHFNNIQAAIDDANDGDVVIVADGMYRGAGNRDIDFKGKAITVRSASGPENCIIDCNGTEAEPHRGFYFHSGEDARSVLEGFIITHGYGANDWDERSVGGAILCTSSSPAIANCKISGNWAGYGGGLCLLESNAKVANCTLSENAAEYGGAIRCHLSSPWILDCNITANTARDHGGAIGIWEGYPVISRCLLTENMAGYEGGAISYGGNQDPTISYCTISRNSASMGGGVMLGVGSRTTKATISHCVISANSAAYYLYGGGVHLMGAGFTRDSTENGSISNCVVTGNSTGIAVTGGAWTIQNCTVAGSKHIGIKYDSSNNSLVLNTILWDNGLQLYIDSSVIGGPASAYVIVSHSNVEGGLAQVEIWPIRCTVDWADGNTDVDPWFAYPGYWDPNGTGDDADDDFWVDGDYHLKSQAGRWEPTGNSKLEILNSELWSVAWVKDDVSSPCIDAGNPTTPIGLEPFPNGGIINMGAYGGTTEASKSYFGEPVCETIVAGDLNGDCKVDFEDLAILASRWLTEN